MFISRDPFIRQQFQGIWEHCLGVAHVARELAARTGLKADTAYLAGLFHDIGKPVVAALLLDLERQGQQNTEAFGGAADALSGE